MPYFFYCYKINEYSVTNTIIIKTDYTLYLYSMIAMVKDSLILILSFA